MANDDAMGTAVAQAVAQQIAMANDRLGWRGGRIHDGVHQARKALRRARAVLALAAPRLGGAVPAIDAELAAIGLSLSALRDAKARVETLDRLLKHPGGNHALLRRCRRAAVAARAAAARASLVDDPGLALRRARLTQVQAVLPILPWASLQPADLDLALLHAHQRAHKAHARARRKGRDRDWHRWRRRVRLLLHARDVLAAIGVAIDPPKAADVRLAAALGFAQDLAVLKCDCVAGVVFADAERKALRPLLKKQLQHARAAADRHAKAASGCDGGTAVATATPAP